MSKKPIILHIIDELRIGGAQTHLLTMLRAAKRSYDVDHRILSLSGDGQIGDQIRSLGIPIEILDMSGLLKEKKFINAIKVLKDVIAKVQPDIVEAHLTWSRLLGLWAARSKGVRKRIGFEHGDIYFNSWKWRAANFVGQFFADEIIVCSQALASWVHNTHGVLSSKMKVFYNCVDPEAFCRPDNSGDERRKLGIPDSAVAFCAVGTLGGGVNKRMDVCIDAFSRIRKSGVNAVLVICGDGPMRGKLEQVWFNH